MRKLILLATLALAAALMPSALASASPAPAAAPATTAAAPTPAQLLAKTNSCKQTANGINPDPSNGGTDSGVTYICFKNSTVSPIENHGNAVSKGQSLASTFVNNN